MCARREAFHTCHQEGSGLLVPLVLRSFVANKLSEAPEGVCMKEARSHAAHSTVTIRSPHILLFPDDGPDCSASDAVLQADA